MNAAREDTGLFMLKVILLLAFGMLMFMVGYITAMEKVKLNPPPCKLMPKPAEHYPKTKAEVQRFIISYLRQGQGVVK